MNSNNDACFAIKEEFQRLIQPLDENGRAELQKEVFMDDKKREVHVWSGYHLNDQERLDTCGRVMVQPKIIELEFNNWISAAIYICNTELRRTDLTNDYRKYLIGKCFEYEKRVRHDSTQGTGNTSIANRLAKEYSISAGTVIKYYSFSSSMDYVYDESPELAKRILGGQIRVSHENMIELSRLKPDEVRAVEKATSEDDIDWITISYIRNEVKWSHIQHRAPSSRKERQEQKRYAKPAIREMPEYDPDAEVNSLCMTIDSWVSSIQRVNNSENLSKITNKASLRLMKKLTYLEGTIGSIQNNLVERTGM